MQDGLMFTGELSYGGGAADSKKCMSSYHEELNISTET